MIHNVVMDELVDLNNFRMNGQLQNKIFSTCPIIPKFHMAFGEPIERQEASTEHETTKDSDPKKGQANRLLGR